jgi:type I restriction-modification system DNA methylase subunit
MALTKEHLRVVMTGTQENRVEELRKILGYPVKELDREGSRFWYLRPGESKEDAADTCPIAVGFYAELNDGSDRDIRQFLIAPEQQNNIYGHYVGRVTTEQPVMYLLLPEANLQGRVALILPTEGGLRQRQIQTFEWSDRELPGRLSRLQQGTVRIADRLTALIPQVDWVFYPGVKTAEKLAQLMAEVARRIEQAIPSVYETETAGGYLHKLFESFRKELLPTLKLQADNEKDYSFADIYAQTVAYGLFTARVFGFLKFKREKKNPNDLEPDFYRDNAWEFLPETNPFLRKLFEDISKQPPEDLGEDLVSAVSELLSVLRAAEMDAVLSDFEQKIGQEDIIIRFYEDFLKAYKPQMRERRGVYYTPEPVVSYMVRVDILLKEKFNKPLGLADPEVMILDPACGTGTFLLWICQLIYQRFQELPEALTEGLADKSWSSYVKERLLPRIFGFELLMAPYAIAHLKLSLFLEETGYQFDSGKRLGVYLTNSLEDTTRKADILFEEFIAEEANQAIEIKQEKPISVIIGNPPYSGLSANLSENVKRIVDPYRYIDGEKIVEKSALQFEKNIQDDYVKFFAFSQAVLNKIDKAILALVTNHSFLDSLTLRGLRNCLLKQFSSLYLIDLQGSVKRKFAQINNDENVFDIQQGVAISLFIKDSEENEFEKIKRADVFGTREEKYRLLMSSNLDSTIYEDIKPVPPYYLFVKQDLVLKQEYEKNPSLISIFSQYSSGTETGFDKLMIGFNSKELFQKIYSFLNDDSDTKTLCEKWGIEGGTAAKILKITREFYTDFKMNGENYILPFMYRVFDTRCIYYKTEYLKTNSYKTMQHLLKQKNLALIAFRQQSQQGFHHIFVTSIFGDKNAVSLRTREINYYFPLYLYSNQEHSLDLSYKEQRYSNFYPNFLKDITNKLGYTPTPEAIFYYIYAILHSPTYRTRYAEFLKIDFPRVPLTSSDKLFHQLAAYGEELVALHLMKSPKLDNTITQYEDRGGDRVVDIAPKYQQGDVIINKKGDRFTGVPENVWNFYVGGYQVCQKWLKDRKGRTLSDEDILHYMRIVVALQETIELMAKIDAAIPGFPIQ